MPDKSEKQRRKELLDAMKTKSREEFIKNLPMGIEKFKRLFDYLDEELSENDCDDTNKLTRDFLEKNGQQNIETVLEWLADHGGYCDCEILANVEELFIV
jgi:malonyl CoA-acyl carrier protein transacylase